MGIVGNILLGWTNVWPQVFLSTGLTIALGGVVFVLQRSWVKEVSEEVQQFTEKTGSAIQDIRERTAELEEEIRSHKPISLDEIRDLVEQNTKNLEMDHRDAFNILNEDLSFDNLAKVLAAAQGSEAIAHGFRVRTSYALKGHRLEVHLVDTSFGVPVNPYISFRVVPFGVTSPNTSYVKWDLSRSIEDIFPKLLDTCHEANLSSIPPEFDFIATCTSEYENHRFDVIPSYIVKL